MCEELIVEIFSRLPSKSLVRFRSVSKSLCARIGNPSFIKLHTLQSPKKVMMIHELGRLTKICTLYSQRQFPNIGKPIELPIRCGGSRIVGSCNGLVCVYDYRGIYLWNPSIRRRVTIHERLDDGCRARVSGFGFDPVSEDYKILRISKASSFVYTVKTHTLREIASPATSFMFEEELTRYHVDFEKTLPSCPPCLLNGALHWAVMRRDLYPDHHYIMTFDLSSEVYSKIELPEPTWKINLVTIINGYLAVITSDDHHGRRHFGRRHIMARVIMVRVVFG
ncbi:F-box protein At5g18160-like [Bidens hawaiensis]|uniref:F-box protein At5g18160-like n=1 Tax=Bidens hawaiensis TaxID=980011 RepID=UPI004048F587